MLEQVKEMLELARQEVRNIWYQKMFSAVHSVENEALEMIAKVAERKGQVRLADCQWKAFTQNLLKQGRR